MAATTSFVFVQQNKKTTDAIQYLDGDKEWWIGGLSPWASTGTARTLTDTSTPAQVTPAGHIVFCDPKTHNIHREGGPAIILKTGTIVFADQGKTTRVEFSDGETWTPTLSQP